MQLILIIAGGFIGSWLADISQEMLGMGAGAIVGYLLAQRRSVNERLRTLEKTIKGLSERQSSSSRTAQTRQAKRAIEPISLDGPELQAPVEATAARQAPPEPDNADGRAPLPAVALPNAVEKLIEAAKGWITTGNMPVKIGVIVSFFGVAFLLKYAVERQVLVVPIELRYLAVAAAGVALLSVGWRLRSRLQVYALSLQGGGIGMLYLTIFAAFRLHPLLPAPFAFALLIALTAFTGVLAVIQEARALAILGTVGGFLAPVLVSTGTGSHVALFSYYLLLNAAILGIAWFRVWRELNVIGFAFTFVVSALWGYEYYRPELFASTEPFLLAYFLFYQCIAVLFAFRQPPKLRGLVDGTIVFGTPVIAFALQSRLVENTEYGLAISAIVVAVFYTLVASGLQRMQGKQMRLLIESFIALGVAFATLAVPLALDDRWTAVAWALEGAALVWVGVRQSGLLAKLSGTALLGAGGLAYLAYGWKSGVGLPVLNGNFVGGMLISLAALFSARYFAADKHQNRGQEIVSSMLLLWGVVWWGGTGTMEILDRASGDAELHIMTAFVALSVGVLAWLGRYFDWLAARRTTLAYLPLLPVMALLYLWQHGHVFAGMGALSWVAAVIIHFAVLYAYDDGRGRAESYWHFAGVLLFVVFVAHEIYWRMHAAAFSDVWAASGALVLPVFAVVMILMTYERCAWPLRRYWSAYLAAAGALMAAQLLLVAGVGIDNPGDPGPLPYIPVLNPFDLLTIAGLAVAMQVLFKAKSTTHRLESGKFRVAIVVFGLVAFALSTLAVVRGVHHFAGVPWHQHALANSVFVQSALSIYWAILGFVGMVLGTRRTQRWIWLTGTGLMALVVAKLFLVDLGNTGTLARIISFLGVGAMLLVVGYFAPAPPRQQTQDIT